MSGTHTLRDMATRMSTVEKTNNSCISKGAEQIKTHQLRAAQMGSHYAKLASCRMVTHASNGSQHLHLQGAGTHTYRYCNVYEPDGNEQYSVGSFNFL